MSSSLYRQRWIISRYNKDTPKIHGFLKIEILLLFTNSPKAKNPCPWEDTAYIFFYSETQIPSSYYSAKKCNLTWSMKAATSLFWPAERGKRWKITSPFVHLPLTEPNQAHQDARQPGLDGHLLSSNSDWAWGSSRSSERRDLWYESEAINHLCLTGTLLFTFACT